MIKVWPYINRKDSRRAAAGALALMLFFLLIPFRTSVYGGNAKYIVLMIADGWGQKAIEATGRYTGTTPPYQFSPWTQHWVSTYPSGGSYNTNNAWSNFNYVMNGFTDSSAAATALYTGSKTVNGRVAVSSDGSTRFYSIGEVAKEYGMSVGAITTVPVSHATPGTWIAHNDDRGNTYAIADEGLFGDPNTTGTVAYDIKYGGGHGPTLPTVDVLIGAGGVSYISSPALAKLRNESGQPGKHVLVERQAGQNGGAALMTAANDPGTKKLAGLFNEFYHNADNSGYDPENPTLAESAAAALKVLNRNANGFVLMIEGGAVDYSAHANNLNLLIGEQRDFNEAVQAVINWVNDPANDSNWNNTLVIVTGDHETGYLTAGQGVFAADRDTKANIPLGAVNDTTLAREKIVSGTGGLRASWEDINGNSIINSGETVYWYWNTGDHVNTLIPLYALGAGAELFAAYETNNDIVRGPYLDNTKVFSVMDNALLARTCTQSGSLSVIPGQTLYGNPVDLTTIVAATNATNLNYTVSEGEACPAQSSEALITRGDSWKYDLENTGTAWMHAGYDDSGWSSGWGIFGTEPDAPLYGYSITTPISNTNLSMFFRKTFYVCDPSQVTALKLNTLFDDGVAVYINGTLVFSQGVSGNPPLWNGGAVGHDAMTYETKDLTSLIGLNALRNLLVPGGNNVIAAGVYNIVLTPPTISSDIVWDGELLISNNASDSALFSGDETAARSVDTTGWTNGLKSIMISGDDSACLTPLTPAEDVFTFDSSSNNDQDPVSAVTSPANGAKLNKTSPNPYTISGTASDNIAVTDIEISINGGAWTSVTTCAGCGTAGASWTYLWALPGDGSYTIRSRAIDSSGSVETPGTGSTVVIDRTSPFVSSTVPSNGAYDITVNSPVTIKWNENVDCSKVSPSTVTISPPVGWTVTSCGGSQAVFTPSGQSYSTAYTVTVSASVTDSAGNAMTANYVFSYTTNAAANIPPSLTILKPDAQGYTVRIGDPVTISYTLIDPDDIVTAAFYYDKNNSGLDGHPIAGGCAAAAEGTGVTCTWNTAGMRAGNYYVYGITNDGHNIVSAYSAGKVRLIKK